MNLRVTNYWGGDALLLVSRSSGARLEGVSVEGKLGRVARIQVRDSGKVRIRHAAVSRCGERMNCVQLRSSRQVEVAASVFHSCAGCDFVAVNRVDGLVLRGNTFDQATVGTCERGCWHPDLVQVYGGTSLLIEGNQFGATTGGAAQVYISAAYATDGVTVRGNVFHPVANTGLIVGNPPGYNGLASRVLVEGNQILSGTPRMKQGHWTGVSNSLIVSDGYLNWPVEARPIVVGNTLAVLSHPELLCATAQVGPEQGC